MVPGPPIVLGAAKAAVMVISSAMAARMETNFFIKIRISFHIVDVPAKGRLFTGGAGP